MRRLAGTSALLASLGSAALAQDQSICAKPDSVAFRGNSRVSESALRSDVSIVPGVQINAYRTLQRSIKNLWDTQQFDDIVIQCEIVGGRPILVIQVTERPLLGAVDVRGPRRVSEGNVRDQVDILIGRPINPAQVAKVVARIDSLYESKGFYLADIRAETTHVDAGAKVTFVVNEGRRLAISGVRIEGNSRVSGKSLVSAMETKPEGFLWFQKGEFDDDKYAADLTEKLPQAYAKHGFIDMTLSRDSLVVDRERGKALVDLKVEEGPQYVVGNFEVNGARRFNSDEVKRFYPFGERGKTLKEALADVTKVVRRGERDPSNVFDQSKWDEATSQLRDAYANEGYIYASLQPVVERVRLGADSVPTVNLRWDIDERTPAIINRVEILGNDVTSEACIRDQILMVPGDVFNRDLLLRSYQSISQMGFFETPVPAPDTKTANENGDIDIVFRVQEKRTGQVSFGASVGQGVGGVGGFIGFEQPNLFGLCKRASLQWQYGQYINDFNMSYTDPRIKQSRVSGTVSLYHSQSRFIIGDLGRQTRAGGSLRFGFQMPRSRWTRLFLEYSGENVKYGDEGFTSTIGCGSGSNCFRSSVAATIDRDTRVDMPFPSMGAHHSLSAAFNGGPLGGSAAFQRYTSELRGYTTLATFGGSGPGSSPLKLVTGITTKMGAVFGDPGPFFVYQSFSMGGVQYTEQLRGYREFSITPIGYIPETSTFQAQQQSFGRAFFSTSAELGLRVSQQLYLSSFFDAGNIWAEPRHFNPTRLFRGAGFGGALVTPLGPLGLDVAYGFDRVDEKGRPAPQWQVHFKFGQFF